MQSMNENRMFIYSFKNDHVNKLGREIRRLITLKNHSRLLGFPKFININFNSKVHDVHYGFFI